MIFQSAMTCINVIALFCVVDIDLEPFFDNRDYEANFHLAPRSCLVGQGVRHLTCNQEIARSIRAPGCIPFAFCLRRIALVARGSRVV